jgi:tRNA (mo5U34)-methyltransferase
MLCPVRGTTQNRIQRGAPMDAEQLKSEVARIRWFHTIPLGHGIVTPGVDRSSERLATFGLPEDLRGRTVLDIGAWDGFCSFEAERRGASRVLATDSYSWSGEGWGSKAGFELARTVLGSTVEDKEIDVLDLSPDAVGVFDLVLFLGVLYHMRHPLLALERVAGVTGEQLILDTHADLLRQRRPAMAFYSDDELADDPTNWGGPNPAALNAMLRDVGFGSVEVVASLPSFPRRIIKAVRQQARGQASLNQTLSQARIVVHARR